MLSSGSANVKMTLSLLTNTFVFYIIDFEHTLNNLIMHQPNQFASFLFIQGDSKHIRNIVRDGSVYQSKKICVRYQRRNRYNS